MNNSRGFTYIELLVTFSLTILILASVLTLSGAIIGEGEHNADELVLQREASALHFLVLNEIKQGYNFRVMGGDLYFQLDPSNIVKWQFGQSQLVRLISTRGEQGPFDGYILLGRYVDHAIFSPDADRNGVDIRIHFKKGEAELTMQTYWRSRVERDGG